MSIYTHGWESDPRRDGCDSCQDLRNELAELRKEAERAERLQRSLHDRADDIDALEEEVSRLKIDEEVWRRSFVDLSARHLQALSDIETLRTAADRLTAAEALRNIVLTEAQMALTLDHLAAASALSPGPDSP